MKSIFLICTLIHLGFLLLSTPLAEAHPKAFMEEMVKYEFIDKTEPEIMVMEKDELDALRKYLSSCSTGKNWPVESLPFFQCQKAELDYVIEFAKSGRILDQVIHLLGQDRQKASSEVDEMRKTAVHQMEGLLQIWVRARYHQLRLAK
jgi:hypothetical protein